MKQRAVSLDVLRGLAIIGMVLSSSIGPGLPAWMHHAQEPPPDFTFHPEISGLTWVDVVFPVFLFAMGAAFSFSIGKRVDKGNYYPSIIWDIVKRGVKLAFFSIYVQHFYSYMLLPEWGGYAWGWSIIAFLLLFPMFMRIPYPIPQLLKRSIQIVAYIIGIILLLTVKDAGTTSFSLSVNNPILMILANMAIFGALIYLTTYHNGYIRVFICCLLLTLYIGGVSGDSWQNLLMKATPLPGIYKFEYLLYLLIVLPGSIAGDWMRKCLESGINSNKNHQILILCTRLCAVGVLLLLLGICIEPFQGGIKKDPPSLSYLFITGGISFILLLLFYILCDYCRIYRLFRPLSMSGQNPMIAYVTCDLLIYPSFNLLGILSPIMTFFSSNPWLAFLQGIFFTSLVICVTMFFTHIKWFWRT